MVSATDCSHFKFPVYFVLETVLNDRQPEENFILIFFITLIHHFHWQPKTI